MTKSLIPDFPAWRGRLSAGFTLTEMAIVLVIIALLIGGMLIPLGTQQDIRADRETQARLNEIKDALIGYAAANGRLPCPAPANSGVESPSGGSVCTSTCTTTCNTTSNGIAYGFIPATTLGIASVDANGHALDGWNQPIRYAVSAATVGGQASPFTTPSGVKTATMSSIATATLLSVCNTTSSGGVTGAGTAGALCSSASKMTDNGVAVIWSTGKNTATGGTSADEAQNQKTTGQVDPAFIYHVSAPSTASGGEFDDQLIWISPNILFNRLIAAGQLP